MGKKDIFTSVVRVKGSDEVDKGLWIEMSKVVSRLYVSIPIKMGSIICKNILNSGVDIICTRDIQTK